ncbi:MAG: orotidine 5'-phosphate decarboxylase / HUMPS family protein, partial [Acidobacteriota bacterium]
IGIVRGALGREPWIVVPGVRLVGDSKDDQARTVTPPEAVRLGATHLVVGRPITRAADPAQVYQQILETL